MRTNLQNFPERIDQLFDQLNIITDLLAKEPPVKEGSNTLNLENAIAFLAHEGCVISKSSMYKLTSKSLIPFKRFGSKLIFDKDELLKWCSTKTYKSGVDSEVISKLAISVNKKINLNYGK